MATCVHTVSTIRGESPPLFPSTYGAERAHGCELLPTRYDRVVEALGGHGELVTDAVELGPALERAVASGKPACVNVMIERLPSPALRRPG